TRLGGAGRGGVGGLRLNLRRGRRARGGSGFRRSGRRRRIFRPRGRARGGRRARARPDHRGDLPDRAPRDARVREVGDRRIGAARDDLLRGGRTDARQRLEILLRGRVQIDRRGRRLLAALRGRRRRRLLARGGGRRGLGGGRGLLRCRGLLARR